MPDSFVVSFGPETGHEYTSAVREIAILWNTDAPTTSRPAPRITKSAESIALHRGGVE